MQPLHPHTRKDNRNLSLQVFREVGAPVDSASAWARYMVLDGGAGDTARCVTLQYVEDEASSSGFGGQGRGTRDAPRGGARRRAAAVRGRGGCWDGCLRR